MAQPVPDTLPPDFFDTHPDASGTPTTLPPDFFKPGQRPPVTGPGKGLTKTQAAQYTRPLPAAAQGSSMLIASNEVNKPGMGDFLADTAGQIGTGLKHVGEGIWGAITDIARPPADTPSASSMGEAVASNVPVGGPVAASLIRMARSGWESESPQVKPLWKAGRRSEAIGHGAAAVFPIPGAGPFATHMGDTAGGQAPMPPPAPEKGQPPGPYVDPRLAREVPGTTVIPPRPVEAATEALAAHYLPKVVEKGVPLIRDTAVAAAPYVQEGAKGGWKALKERRAEFQANPGNFGWRKAALGGLGAALLPTIGGMAPWEGYRAGAFAAAAVPEVWNLGRGVVRGIRNQAEVARNYADTTRLRQQTEAPTTPATPTTSTPPPGSSTAVASVIPARRTPTPPYSGPYPDTENMAGMENQPGPPPPPAPAPRDPVADWAATQQKMQGVTPEVLDQLAQATSGKNFNELSLEDQTYLRESAPELMKEGRAAGVLPPSAYQSGRPASGPGSRVETIPTTPKPPLKSPRVYKPKSQPVTAQPDTWAIIQAKQEAATAPPTTATSRSGPGTGVETVPMRATPPLPSPDVPITEPAPAAFGSTSTTREPRAVTAVPDSVLVRPPGTTPQTPTAEAFGMPLRETSTNPTAPIAPAPTAPTAPTVPTAPSSTAPPAATKVEPPTTRVEPPPPSAPPPPAGTPTLADLTTGYPSFGNGWADLSQLSDLGLQRKAPNIPHGQIYIFEHSDGKTIEFQRVGQQGRESVGQWTPEEVQQWRDASAMRQTEAGQRKTRQIEIQNQVAERILGEGEGKAAPSAAPATAAPVATAPATAPPPTAPPTIPLRLHDQDPAIIAAVQRGEGTTPPATPAQPRAVPARAATPATTGEPLVLRLHDQDPAIQAAIREKELTVPPRAETPAPPIKETAAPPASDLETQLIQSTIAAEAKKAAKKGGKKTPAPAPAQEAPAQEAPPPAAPAQPPATPAEAPPTAADIAEGSTLADDAEIGTSEPGIIDHSIQQQKLDAGAAIRLSNRMKQVEAAAKNIESANTPDEIQALSDESLDNQLGQAGYELSKNKRRYKPTGSPEARDALKQRLGITRKTSRVYQPAQGSRSTGPRSIPERQFNA